MDAKLQIRVQRYGWDKASIHYQNGWQKQLLPAQNTLFEFARLQPGMRVLETACGTGLVTCPAAEMLEPGGSILATDLSGEMVKETTRIAAENGIRNVEVMRMGAENLEVEDASFDAAICALGLMYVPDPQVAISEMYRSVKKGGKVVATVWGERKNCGWAEIFPIVDSQVASEVCPLFFGTGAPNVLKTIFESCGMIDIQEKRQFENLQFSDSLSLLEAIFDGGPVALAVNRFSDDVLQMVKEKFLLSVKAFSKSDGSYVIPGEYVTVSGKVQS